jgi:uncharacterized protein
MDLPLFPLHTVLCPGVALPLHVFEERYQAMVERCLAESSAFGVILIREGREVGFADIAVAEIGTMAEIREATRHENGRYDLLAIGTHRFRLDSVRMGPAAYLIGEVTQLAEEVGRAERAHRLADRVSRQFVRYLGLLAPADEDPAADDEPAPEPEPLGVVDDAARRSLLDEAARSLTIPDDPTVLSYLLSGIVQVETIRRQSLLEMPTTELRLAELARLLKLEISLLERRLMNYAPDPRFLVLRRN